MEDENYELKEQLEQYTYSLEGYGYNSIEEMNEKIDSLDTKISNMWSGIFWIGLIVICIIYNIGVSHGSKK